VIRSQLVLILSLAFGVLLAAEPGSTMPDRQSVITRASVWTPTDVARMDIKAGAPDPTGFPFRSTIHCTHLDRSLSGRSPKFACELNEGDELKVKYGGTNGEVFAEVAATRLLWALGFGADRMYPVRVICKGCPRELNGNETGVAGEFVFDPAVVERKMPGSEFAEEEGWAWEELDLVNEAAGGALRAHRDALKLLAVFMQHTDSKPQQQRLVCVDGGDDEHDCANPLMMLNDVGLTFGRANTFNLNAKAGMNLAEWSRTPVWKDADGCVGNLPKSFTGTLNNPVISEAGRHFLATLLAQLSDQQLRDLFSVARVTLRPRDPRNPRLGFPAVEEWVQAFHRKRDEIATRQCE